MDFDHRNMNPLYPLHLEGRLYQYKMHRNNPQHLGHAQTHV